MKLLSFLITLLLFCSISLLNAQAPAGIPYQAVARNSGGNLIANQAVSVRFTIRDITAAGTIVYRETHALNTNSLGLFTATIGLGTPVSGTFSALPWNNGAKFLQVEIDTLGGSSFIDMGTQQLMSVPYALVAGNVPNGSLNNTMYWNGTSWVASSLISNTGSNAGIGTASPDASALLELNSTTKGFLLPRMTTVQREAIVSPAPGLVIFNTDNGCMELRSLSSWLSYCSSTCTPLPTTANAGPDQLVVAGSLNLQGNVPVFGTGKWTILSGSGGFIANVNSPTSFFLGVSGQSYSLRWTITTPCDSSFDLVNIQYSCLAGRADCNGNVADSCEINILSDVNNCGSCGNVCVLPNAISACVGGICDIISCSPNYGNCNALDADGCESALLSDVNNCGTCGNACSFPNALAVCVSGSCMMASCLPNFWNIDGSIANGCEYACTPTGTDVPDNAFTDSNCDGIDGTISSAIFVSTTTGSDANNGTKNAPKKTITNAISTAFSTGKTQILISAGTYNEAIVLSSGISLYGGYAAGTWTRSASNVTAIASSALLSGNMYGIRALNLTLPTTIDQLSIVTSNNSSPGGSNYAVHCSNSPSLSITNCMITAGNAGNGTAGINGVNGAPGGNGAAGTPGDCNSSVTASGGTGGTSSCSRTGGAGGSGRYSSLSGTPGASGAGGTAGGGGGAFGDPGGDGSIGLNGSAGASGTNGAVVVGSFISGLWTPVAGGSGTLGTDGNGGGGGGGGGGQFCITCNPGTGNGGGGGGAGGCRGTVGTGGTGGGSSIGILAYNSSDITIINCTITRGNGGNGGAGGTGGNGGNGGAGGNGAATCLSEVGRGGNGGAGGNGGNAGHGAGGQGGSSIGVVRINSPFNVISGNTYMGGAAGLGGSSAGNPGSNGTVNSSQTL